MSLHEEHFEPVFPKLFHPEEPHVRFIVTKLCKIIDIIGQHHFKDIIQESYYDEFIPT